MSLEKFAELSRSEQGLAVVSTLRADATIQSSLVNVAVMPHPLADGEVVAFVTYGAVKLRNLRARPQLTVVARSGWAWAAVEGHAEIVGPDDPHDGVDADRLRLLLREIFTAAGGAHDDWDEYDRVMREQGRSAVVVRPTRSYSN